LERIKLICYELIVACGIVLVQSYVVLNCDFFSGKIKNLRLDRGDESPMTMVRISHVRQYFVIAFSLAPFELWDLKKLCILRTMPKKFPIVTALAWSPLHSSRSKVLRYKSELFEDHNRKGCLI
jgi:hypothetical protein